MMCWFKAILLWSFYKLSKRPIDFRILPLDKFSMK